MTIYNPGNVASVLGTPSTSAQPILTCDPRKGLAKDQYANLTGQDNFGKVTDNKFGKRIMTMSVKFTF